MRCYYDEITQGLIWLNVLEAHRELFVNMSVIFEK